MSNHAYSPLKMWYRHRYISLFLWDKEQTTFLSTGSSVLLPLAPEKKSHYNPQVISFLSRFFSTFINVKNSLHVKTKTCFCPPRILFYFLFYLRVSDSDPTVSKWDNMVWRPALCFLVCLSEVKTPYVCLFDSWVVFPLFRPLS